MGAPDGPPSGRPPAHPAEGKAGGVACHVCPATGFSLLGGGGWGGGRRPPHGAQGGRGGAKGAARAVPLRAGRDRPPLAAGSGAPSSLPGRLCPRHWRRGGCSRLGSPISAPPGLGPRRLRGADVVPPAGPSGGSGQPASPPRGSSEADSRPPSRAPLCSLKGVPGKR